MGGFDDDDQGGLDDQTEGVAEDGEVEQEATAEDEPLPDEDLAEFEGEEGEEGEEDLELDGFVELSQKEQNARALAIRRAIEQRLEQKRLNEDLDDLDYLDVDD
jgi:hypothetical protein